MGTQVAGEKINKYFPKPYVPQIKPVNESKCHSTKIFFSIGNSIGEVQLTTIFLVGFATMFSGGPKQIFSY